MNTESFDLVDLGDATEETKQLLPLPAFPDNMYYRGLLPDVG